MRVPALGRVRLRVLVRVRVRVLGRVLVPVLVLVRVVLVLELVLVLVRLLVLVLVPVRVLVVYNRSRTILSNSFGSSVRWAGGSSSQSLCHFGSRLAILICLDLPETLYLYVLLSQALVRAYCEPSC